MMINDYWEKPEKAYGCLLAYAVGTILWCHKLGSVPVGAALFTLQAWRTFRFTDFLSWQKWQQNYKKNSQMHSFVTREHFLDTQWLLLTTILNCVNLCL